MRVMRAGSTSSVWMVSPSADAMVVATSFGSEIAPRSTKHTAPRELFEQRVRNGHRDRRLAHAAGANDGHETFGEQVRRDGAHRFVAADHAGEHGRQDQSLWGGVRSIPGSSADASDTASRLTGATKQ